MRVEWDGGFINQPTDENGRHKFILSPGQYAVRVNTGASQRAYFRTNLKKYFGHYTYQVDFVRGECASGSSSGAREEFEIARAARSNVSSPPSVRIKSTCEQICSTWISSQAFTTSGAGALFVWVIQQRDAIHGLNNNRNDPVGCFTVRVVTGL